MSLIIYVYFHFSGPPQIRSLNKYNYTILLAWEKMVPSEECLDRFRVIVKDQKKGNTLFTSNFTESHKHEMHINLAHLERILDDEFKEDFGTPHHTVTLQVEAINWFHGNKYGIFDVSQIRELDLATNDVNSIQSVTWKIIVLFTLLINQLME